MYKNKNKIMFISRIKWVYIADIASMVLKDTIYKLTKLISKYFFITKGRWNQI